MTFNNKPPKSKFFLSFDPEQKHFQFFDCNLAKSYNINENLHIYNLVKITTLNDIKFKSTTIKKTKRLKLSYLIILNLVQCQKK